jgi:hypothetical protein
LSACCRSGKIHYNIRVESHDRHKQLSNNLHATLVCFQNRSVYNDYLVEKRFLTDALGLARKIEGCYSGQSVVFWEQIEIRGMSVQILQ